MLLPLVLVSAWRSVLRSVKRLSTTRAIVLINSCMPVCIFSKHAFMSYFQFLKKLEEKVHAKELEQTNLQEKSKVRAAFVLFMSNLLNTCMI
jgi:hypothetical protein